LSQLSIGSNAITTKKPTVVIADGVAGGSLVIRGLSPILSFDRTGASPENKILMDGVGLEFKTGTLDAEGDVDFKIKLDGKLQAPAYTQGFLQSDASGNIEISGGGTLPGGPYLPLAGGTMTTGAVVTFLDSSGSTDNRLKLGTGGDMQLFHDGSDAYVDQTGTGDLILRTSGSGDDVFIRAMDDVFIQPKNGEAGVYIYSNGAVELYYNGSKKFETTSTGVTVTGNGTFTGTVNADTYFQSTDASAVLATNGAGSVFLRPNGPGSGTGALSVASSGNVVALGTVTGTTFTTSAATGWLVKNSGGNHGISYDGTDTVIQNNGVYSIRANGTSVYLRNTYITGLLDVTAGGTFTGTVTSPTFLGDLNGTINTVTTAVTKANATNDATVATTAFVKNLIGEIPAGLAFEGTWDARTSGEGGAGTPPSTTPDNGQFWIVSVDGSQNLSGITDWKVGDWAIYVDNGAGTDAWQKVDNSSVLDGSGTGQTVALWAGSGTSNTLTDSKLVQNTAGTLITAFTNSLNSTGTFITNSEGGGEVGLTVQSRTNRAKLKVADNDSSAYVVAEDGKAFYGTSANGDATNITVLT
jgi:hypothetical protein